MRELSLKLPTSIGEAFAFRRLLPQMKQLYERINISFGGMELWRDALYTNKTDWPEKEIGWKNQCRDLGNLLFSDDFFHFHENVDFKFSYDIVSFMGRYKLDPSNKERISHLLCQGTSLPDKREYLVLTTKVRNLSKRIYDLHCQNIFQILSQKKYLIVLLGEREIEMRKEYAQFGDKIFCLYPDIKKFLKTAGDILDLTLPSLGESVSSLKQIQQDCLLMNEAKAVISIGQGGNVAMANSANAHCINLIEGNDLLYKGINNGEEFLSCLKNI
jgi:hypothetical protein